MAFNGKNENIENKKSEDENASFDGSFVHEMLSEAQAQEQEQETLSQDNPNQKETVVKSVPLVAKPKTENRKTYNFTIKPSVREKINKLAKEYNYKSSSRFIEELIERI